MGKRFLGNIVLSLNYSSMFLVNFMVTGKFGNAGVIDDKWDLLKPFRAYLKTKINK